MVNHRAALAAFTLVLIAWAALASVASAETRVYRFNQEWAKLWINDDGTVDLFYNVSLTLDSGANINFVRLGQPNSDFKVGKALDQYGHRLDASADGTAVRVNLYTPLTAGSTVWFTVITNVGDMLSPDSMNPGNLGMQFAPQWMDVPINDVRIQIVLPLNVTVNDVKTTERFWQGTSTEPDGRLALYWETPVLGANEQYIVGVSFPQTALPGYGQQPAGGNEFLQNYGPLLAGAFFIIVIIVIIGVATRKKAYQTPKVSMETLGIRRGFTAVEASYMLSTPFKPTQIVTEILYSLLQKRAVWAESTKPVLKLRVMPAFQNKKGTDESPLRYYEIDFLEAIKQDGTLSEEKLAKTIMYLRDTVEEKLRGYSRKDTVEYYRKIVDKAWDQVRQAGTAELASNAYDENLLWLLLDPSYRSRTENAFQTRAFEPNPLWFWYWYGYTHYSPRPTYQPKIDAPAQSAKPPSIPGAEFANNIATSLEKTSGNIVANLEKFANSIIPAKPSQASHEPARHGANCVCACATCACACACVSCACACAGGGVG
ncbi:MAG: hypothetical protein ACE14S_04505 [Candidatus Bathyarchaeia archaeon]